MKNLNEIILEKMASKLSNEELEDLIKEASSDIENQEETEKIASSFYDMGQIMARGFRDQQGKIAEESGVEQTEEDSEISTKLAKIKEYIEATKKAPSVLKSMGRRVKSLMQGKTGKKSKALRKLRGQAKDVAKGAVLPGAGAAAVGAGYMAMKKKKQEKTASEELSPEVINAIEVLEAHDLI